MVAQLLQVQNISKSFPAIHLYSSPGTIFGQLSPHEQQMVEITKTLSNESRLLILDEHTAAITKQEIRVLFDAIKRLCENDKS